MIKTSYGELLCRKLMGMWFPEKNVLYNYRPVWLKNPNTGKNLELDIYYPDLKLAVEFNGIQHKLIFQSRKDWFKNHQCEKIGILMLSVYHPLDLFKCKSLIKRHTGIKTKSGNSDKKLLWDLKAYSINDNIDCDWYNPEKIKESDNERLNTKIAESLRRAKVVEKRRELKRDVKRRLNVLLNVSVFPKEISVRRKARNLRKKMFEISR